MANRKIGKKRKMGFGGVVASSLKGSNPLLNGLVGITTGVINDIRDINNYGKNQQEGHLYNFNNTNTPLMPGGGLVNNQQVELEKGEPFMYPNGEIDMISQKAPSHAQGGVPINLPQETKVLGKKPMYDNKTFKQLGAKLKRKGDKYKKVLESSPTKIAENTANLMLQKINKEFNDLFNIQEEQGGSYKMPNGGLVKSLGEMRQEAQENYEPYYNTDSYTFTPEQIRAAKENDIISQKPFNDPNTKELLGYERYRKGVSGPSYDLIGKNQNGINIQGGAIDPTQQTQKFPNGGLISPIQPYVSGGFNPNQVLQQAYSPKYNEFDVNKEDGVKTNLGATALGAIGSLLPVGYNLVQGLQKPETLSNNAFQNPYANEANSLMANRTYNIQPELGANKLAEATYYRNLREGAPSQGQFLGGLQAGQIATQRADASSFARKQNVDNQYMAEQAQFSNQLGNQEANRQMYIDDINAKTEANRRNILGGGLNQMSQFTQNSALMANQMIRDAQKLNLLPALVQNFELSSDGTWIYRGSGEKIDTKDVWNFIKGKNINK